MRSSLTTSAQKASAFDRLATDIDHLVANLRAPTVAGDALAGPELRPAEAAFIDLWGRCARDLSTLAKSVRQVAATLRAAADVYRQTDAAVASDAQWRGHAL